MNKSLYVPAGHVLKHHSHLVYSWQQDGSWTQAEGNTKWGQTHQSLDESWCWYGKWGTADLCSTSWREQLERGAATGMLHCGVLSCRIQARDTQTPSSFQRPFWTMCMQQPSWIAVSIIHGSAETYPVVESLLALLQIIRSTVWKVH